MHVDRRGRSAAEESAAPSALDGSAVLSAESVDKRFSGLQALSDVSLSVHRGEVVGIIGPNGAGKSTLINVLSGLYRPDRGRILLGGKDVSRANAAARARMGLSRTFQQTRALSSFTVREALRLAYGAPRVRRRTTGDKVGDVAERYGLAPHLDKLVTVLPYGGQKVLNMAMMMICEPTVVLLDEPFAGVTADDVQILGQVATDMAAEGAGVALVEHDMLSLMRLSHRVVVLDAGRTVAEGNPAEVQANDLVQEIYLGRSHDDGGRSS
jgi:branched-chain amino acid transport system ATP-binding protein